MSKIRMLGDRVPTLSTQIAGPPVKVADPFYHSAEYRIWRELVINRAGERCEWIEDGNRCPKAAPLHRMFADHIVERRDGGAPFDPANGQCLCYGHHNIKTCRERAARNERENTMMRSRP